jgi:hypothetical protein
MKRLLFLTVLLLAVLLENRAVNAAWFGDEYFDERCEEETKRRLIFPGSYKSINKTHKSIEPNRQRYKNRNALNAFHRFIVNIEFTSKNRSNKTLRNISHCDMTFHFLWRGPNLGDKDRLMEGTIYFDYELELERIQRIDD